MHQSTTYPIEHSPPPVARQDVPPRSLDNEHSSFREKMLEHVFISELVQEAWFRFNDTIEVLRPDVDSFGYDLVLAFKGVVRHVQLKGSRKGSTTRSQNVSIQLGEKPNGCVVWILYEEDPSLRRIKLEYLFFGGGPGERLPALGDKVSRHTRANAKGEKKKRANFRSVNRGRFRRVADPGELFQRLFLDETPGFVTREGGCGGGIVG